MDHDVTTVALFGEEGVGRGIGVDGFLANRTINSGNTSHRVRHIIIALFTCDSCELRIRHTLEVLMDLVVESMPLRSSYWQQL